MKVKIIPNRSSLSLQVLFMFDIISIVVFNPRFFFFFPSLFFKYSFQPEKGVLFFSLRKRSSTLCKREGYFKEEFHSV